MNALVTGSNGTVGSVLLRRLREIGSTATGWDRGRAPAGDESAAESLIDAVAPSVIFHLALPSNPTGAANEGWLVNEKWTGDMARLAAERSIAFVYISTVMVFTNCARGPFPPETPPDETEGYGFSKLQGERAAVAANPNARIARFGWQIGNAPGSNNMIHHLEKQFSENGEITASTKWMPATSFIEDTADALISVSSMAPGVYHIDSNRSWNFHEIVTALNVLHGGRWKIRATEDFEQDQRMIDPRLDVPGLDKRLGTLKALSGVR